MGDGCRVPVPNRLIESYSTAPRIPPGRDGIIMGCGPKINSTQCNPSQPKAGCMGSCWGDPIVISANVGVIPASFRHIRGSLELVWTNLGVTRGTFGSIWGSFEPSGKSSVQARLGARWGKLGAVVGCLGSRPLHPTCPSAQTGLNMLSISRP